MKVVVLGKGLMLANIILGVLDAGAEIAGVFRYEQTCTPKLKLKIEDFFKPAPEVTLIKDLKLPQIRCKSANSEEFRNLMISKNVDLIIVGTWKEKLEPETYNIPKIATVNIHPSLLPKYRGPNPYLQTILHGEEFSGVTIHLLNDKYDDGAILKQEKVRILDSDTSKELKERTTRIARDMVSELISDLTRKILTPVEQNEKYSTYYPNISGDEKMLDFNQQTSVEISRTIKALHPFLPTYITYKDVFFIVDPYNFRIIDEIVDYPPNSIISKDSNMSSITIVCKDSKPIKFNKLRLYKHLNTKKYISRNVEVIK